MGRAAGEKLLSLRYSWVWLFLWVSRGGKVKGYVIQRIGKGNGFVAPTGSERSYVRDVRRARIFATVEDAEANRCPENERIMSLAGLFELEYRH